MFLRHNGTGISDNDRPKKEEQKMNEHRHTLLKQKIKNCFTQILCQYNLTNQYTTPDHIPHLIIYHTHSYHNQSVYNTSISTHMNGNMILNYVIGGHCLLDKSIWGS